MAFCIILRASSKFLKKKNNSIIGSVNEIFVFITYIVFVKSSYYSFLAENLCTHSLDPDQDRQNLGLDLDSNC